MDAERGAHGLEVIERNVVAQAKLIDDLLDVSRIITGKLRLSVRRASLASVIDAACEAMRPAAEAKEIDMVVAVGIPEGEDMIVGDPDRLQQVVWNLISNSIKFTPAGPCHDHARPVGIRLPDPRRGHRAGNRSRVPRARLRAFRRRTAPPRARRRPRHRLATPA